MFALSIPTGRWWNGGEETKKVNLDRLRWRGTWSERLLKGKNPFARKYRRLLGADDVLVNAGCV